MMISFELAGDIMNHLLIGLGGTGARVLKAFRKAMYQSYRDTTPNGIFIDYLLLDSDPLSFVDRGDWTVLGQSLFLPKRCHFPISRGNLKSVLEDIAQHENIRPWLGDRTAWDEITTGLKEDSAGGQKRRLGRFLFALKAKDFVSTARGLVGELQQQSKTTDITFHIFTGLAGGTGSGSFIDVVTQLRKEFPDIGRHRVILYAYVPDLNPPASWTNGGNYFANGYAALLEYNALLAGAWKPYDVVTGKRLSLDSDVWADSSYVFSDENDRGYRANIQGELMDIVANFVFHKIVVASQTNWGALKRAESFENVNATAELDPGSKRGQRAVQFLSFGIRRIEFPEERIREYLTYDFAAQAYRQLQYNNWLPDYGYQSEPRPRADAEFVADKKQLEDWRLTDEHVRLNLPIIEAGNTRTLPRIEDEWQAWENNFVGKAQTGDKVGWINELKKLFQTAREQSFRTTGVKSYFSAAERDVKNHADEIRNRIETSLFRDWRTGERSLNECGRVVTALIRSLEGRLPSFDKSIQDQETEEARLAQALDMVTRNWNKIVLGLFSAYEKELRNAAQLLRQQAICETRIFSARFAKLLIPQVVLRLQELKTIIDEAEAGLALAGRRALDDAQANAPQAEGQTTSSDYVTTIEDRKTVEAARRRIALDEDEQKIHTTAVREKLIEALGADPSFRSLRLKINGADDIHDVIIATCERNVSSSHQRLVIEARDRVIGVSVIEKLRHLWGNDPSSLRREVEGIVKSAGHFITFDATERNKKQAVAERAIQAYGIIIPEPQEHRDFVKSLKDAFRDACTSPNVEFVTSHERSNEITLISLVYLFPLRYLNLCKQLKKKYEERIAKESWARVALEIHIEDIDRLPSLFFKDAQSVSNDARRLLLMAQAAQIIRVAGSGNAQRLIVPRKDDLGLDLEPLELGRSLTDAADTLSESHITLLSDQVTQALPNLDRVQARAAILAAIQDIKVTRSDDPTDKIVLAWSDSARTAIGELENGNKV